MERDEETGLSYHGARYYVPWLGRWTAADPIGLGDGVNRFRYSSNNPVGFVDRTGTRANGPADEGSEEEKPTSDPYAHLRDTSFESFGIEEGNSPASRPEVEEPDRGPDGPIIPDTSGEEKFKAEQRKRHQQRLEQLETNARVGEAVTASGEKALDSAQASLDAIGLIEGLGTPADLLNAGISAARGNGRDAALSLASALPFLGIVFGGGKIATKHGDEAFEVASDVAKKLDGDVGKVGNSKSVSNIRSPEVVEGAATAKPKKTTPEPSTAKGSVAAKDIILKGFSNGKLATHFTKHGAEFGAKTAHEYLKAAKEFAQAEGPQFVEKAVGNHIFKYDKSQDALLIINGKNRTIKTFYKNDGRSADILGDAMREHAKVLAKQRGR